MLSSNRKYVFIHGGFSYVSVLERYPKVPARPAKLAQKPLKKWIIRCLFLGELNLPPKKKRNDVGGKKNPMGPSGDRSVNGMMIFFADPGGSAGGGILGIRDSYYLGGFERSHLSIRSHPQATYPWKMGPWIFFTNRFMFICFGISFEFVGVERGKFGVSSQGLG